MTNDGTASPCRQQAVLRNGTPVQIRVALPGDRDRIVAAFNGTVTLKAGATVMASCPAGDHRLEFAR